jgi:hypothetical protein
MDLAPPTTAATNTLPGDPAGALGALRIQKLEDISEAGVKLATQIRERADAAFGGGVTDAWGFARLARGVRQTVAMEIRLFGNIDPERTTRQMAKLAAVSDAGMALARLLERLLSEQKSPALDIVGQFLHVARGVRLVIAMEDWVEADSRMPEAQRMAERARRAAEAAAIAECRRSRQAEKAQGGTAPEACGAAAGLRAESLCEPDVHAEIGDRSVAEVVAAACRDIGVDCDLGLFDDGAPAVLTPALSRGAGEGVLVAHAEGLPLSRIAGEGGARRDGNGRVRVTPQPSGHDPP